MGKTVGSICSGIEAASVAWSSFDVKFKWFSEIASFQSQLLSEKYPCIPNLGDMNTIPERILARTIEAPDVICGGTPCQAFSVTGYRNGLSDERGNLTLKFIDIIDSNDKIRLEDNLDRTIVFWENVEGVLSDKTNAFGCFVSSLAGLTDIIKKSKWPTAGCIHGPTRNVAWRVLDAKYFGLPQQRRRLYVVAGGSDFYPENVLFETFRRVKGDYTKDPLSFEKDGHQFELFREYTDCLYAAYGTKWNGNAAAYNGSLFVVQDERIRRLSPLECERLMGFPDNYTELDKAKKTNRYQAIGNSWAVPVVKWIGSRLFGNSGTTWLLKDGQKYFEGSFFVMTDITQVDGTSINCSDKPNEPTYGSMNDIIDINPPEDIFISPVGCYGILRRKYERNVKMNPKLEAYMIKIAKTMDNDKIEEISKRQPRGQYSIDHEKRNGAYTIECNIKQTTLDC